MSLKVWSAFKFKEIAPQSVHTFASAFLSAILLLGPFATTHAFANQDPLSKDLDNKPALGINKSQNARLAGKENEKEVKVTWSFGLQPKQSVKLNGLTLSILEGQSLHEKPQRSTISKSSPGKKNDNSHPTAITKNPATKNINQLQRLSKTFDPANPLAHLPELTQPSTRQNAINAAGSLPDTDPTATSKTQSSITFTDDSRFAKRLLVTTNDQVPSALEEKDVQQLIEQGEASVIEHGNTMFLYPVVHKSQTIAVVLTNQCPPAPRLPCTEPYVSVFLPTQSGLSRHDLLQSSLGLSLEFYLETDTSTSLRNPKAISNYPNWGIARIKAVGASASQNEYADQMSEARIFAKDTGFVSQSFDPLFLPLIGQDSKVLFSSQAHRVAFSQSVGLDTFRKLRPLMGNSLPSRVYAGRYLTFFGCLTDFCPDSFAVVVLDGVSGLWRWSAVQDRKPAFSGMTSKSNQQAYVDEIDDALFEQAMVSAARDYCFKHSTQNTEVEIISTQIESTESNDSVRTITDESTALDDIIANSMRKADDQEPQKTVTQKLTFKLVAKTAPDQCLGSTLIFD